MIRKMTNEEYVRELGRSDIIVNLDNSFYNAENKEELFKEYMNLTTATYRQWGIKSDIRMKNKFAAIQEKMKMNALVFEKDKFDDYHAAFGYYVNNIPLMFWYGETGCQMTTRSRNFGTEEQLVLALKEMREYLELKDIWNKQKTS